MHYDIDYSAIENADEKRAKAVADFAEYAGKNAYNKIVEYVKAREATDPMDLDEFRMMSSIAGIAGYPVVAVYETLTGRTE